MNNAREQITSTVREILAELGDPALIEAGERLLAERGLNLPFTGRPGKLVRCTVYFERAAHARVEEIARSEKRQHSAVVNELVIKALADR